MGDTARLRWTILGALIAGALVSSLWAVRRTRDWEGLALNLGAEMAGAAATYGLLELVIGRRERQEAEEKKESLITQMGSDVRDVAIPAANELERLGWLTDGSLQRANLCGADLSGADVSRAILIGVKLGGANLNSANLSAANLSGANLSAADLSGVSVVFANLSSANLFEAKVTAEQLPGAASLKGATMPDGTVHD